MVGFRRGCSLLTLSIIAFCATLVYLYSARSKSEWRSIPAISDLGDYLVAATGQDAHRASINSSQHSILAEPSIPYKAIPPEPSYLRHVVVAKMKDEDAAWLQHEDLKGAIPKIYVADDPNAPLTVPSNKGHEAMVYLTYLIDYYDNLPDIAIFMHAHRKSWHQAGLLEHDGAETVRRLSSSRVLREGYMNLRCEWNPGCPRWLHPSNPNPKTMKAEEPVMAQAWTELFPGIPVPDVLAQPCCAQFALSKQQILSVPQKDLVSYRDWLLHTRYADDVSGRVFEYLWQFIFAKTPVFCPDMHACYCDGFGICFKDEKDFDYWFELRWNKHLKEDELQEWRSQVTKLDEYREAGELRDVETLELDVPSAGVDVRLLAEIESLQTTMEEGRQRAIERGKDPAFRALVAGRKWKEGDGY
jgi:hypothetical protein